MRRGRSAEQVEPDQRDIDARLDAAIEQAGASSDPGEFSYVNLKAIADSVGLDQRYLVDAAATGDFAPVLQIRQRTYVVRKRDLLEWEARAEVSARRAPDPRDLDLTPAEPFAHLREKKPAPTNTKCAGQGRRSARTRAQSSTGSNVRSINDATRTPLAGKQVGERAGDDASAKGGRHG